MKTNILIIAILFCTVSCKQMRPLQYTVSNAHSHNDYLQARPFFAAYEAEFGSVEADIFLKDDQLLVSHDTAGLKTAKTLQSLYLNPIAAAIDRNNGKVYASGNKKLILLIDLKTEAVTTLAKLVDVLKEYPDLRSCKTLQIVITGNQPETLLSYPAYVYFDGNFKKNYTNEELKRVALFSAEFKKYSKWMGAGPLPESEKALLETDIAKAHSLHKPVRFWAAPDVPEAWQQLMKLGIDYINTDHIDGLSSYVKGVNNKVAKN